MPPTISLQSLITQEAQAQGVPPSIALAVAQKESNTSQWTQSGNLVTGSSGEIGVFQLMPATAASLGVDPTDVDQNISGGISLLAQLYQKYGSWVLALSAYNSGSPTGSPSYASSVLSMAGSTVPSLSPPAAPDFSIDDSGDDDSPTVSGPIIVGAILGGVALILWAVD
jgi:soluble lytic murein transglycosylase-like protein